MKINIIYKFQGGPWGGGNQFLKALRNEFIKQGIYTDSAEEADVFLFNSHQNLRRVLDLKRKYPKKIFIHRVDGPIDKYRENNQKIDPKIYRYNNIVADGTVFQSKWSQEENHKAGMKKNNFEAVIMNAPDPAIFNDKGKEPFSQDRKTRLVAVSWSPGWNKGFDVYQYLDENLDFSQYEMTFIGRSPIEFKNIKTLEPMPSIELAQTLKKHDIFVFASRREACSNTLLEAMHCGLPVIAPNTSSNPEIVKNGGEVFGEKTEIPGLLDKINSNYSTHQDRLTLPTIKIIANKYVDFINSVGRKCIANQYHPKHISTLNYLAIKFKQKFGIYL